MSETTKKPSIPDRIVEVLSNQKGCVATLKTIYKAFKDKPEETVRAAIYKDCKNRFKRVAEGVYMLNGEDSAALLIQGDGRGLAAVEDNSIALCITDHPWKDEKAHRAGNQKNFAGDYEEATFRYTKKDFENKYRVLKDGAYLVEFVPKESASNWQYLADIKRMATEVGFQYYALCTWCKAPEGKVNTGRTTKGVEDVLIFTKGTPRRLAPPGKPYYTKNILNTRIEIPAPLPKNKVHQAEKPVALYKYFIENLTEEKDICLDAFGGSCNLIPAALQTKRFAIVYEKLNKFIKKAVVRLGLSVLYEEESEQEVYELHFEPAEVAEETNHGKTLLEKYTYLTNSIERLTRFEEDFITSLNFLSLSYSEKEVNELYNKLLG